MRQRRVRAWTEGSGLAGEPTSVDSRVESRASTEQQRQRHSLFVFFHFVVDSVQFFVDASTSFGFCPALNCSYRLSSVPETFSQSADSLYRYFPTSLPHTLILSLSLFPRVFLVSFYPPTSLERALTCHGRIQCARVALLSLRQPLLWTLSTHTPQSRPTTSPRSTATIASLTTLARGIPTVNDAGRRVRCHRLTDDPSTLDLHAHNRLRSTCSPSWP